MKIPNNMTESEVVATITKVARHLAPKYTFSPYDIEDIFQEAFIIGMEGLEKYDSGRPLSGFMFTHISNRLKNFKRDKYYRLDIGNAQQIQNTKKNLNEAFDIDALYSVCSQDQTSNNAQLTEILQLIDEKLPSEYRRDYLKLKTNSSLPKGRKAIIIKVIKEIIDEKG